MDRGPLTRSFLAAVVVALLVSLAGVPALGHDRSLPDRAERDRYRVPGYLRKNTSVRSLMGGRSLSQMEPGGSVRPARLGERRLWPALDDTMTDLPVYLKKFQLRARTEHAEIWTAAGNDEVSRRLRFPDGDCRNDDPSRIKISRDQLRYFLRQFERVIYPRETRWFSTPPNRNGEAALRATIRQVFGVRLPRGHFSGAGKRVVILVDNVRDPNFYDTDNANTLSRTAGFFWNLFNELTDRNVMTIDSFNWLANTTATPPHSPSADPCTNFPASTFGYEGVFAHEFEHLLEYYADPDGETIWVDEGLADWAEYLTYSHPSAAIDDPRYHDHIQCFLGYLEQVTEYNPLPAENCGPENSLNLWGDQVDNEVEILADYGAAFSYMLMLEDRFGKDAMTFLHRANADGFESVRKLLAREGSADTVPDTIHDWLLAMAVDRLLDGGATIQGSSSDLEIASLNAMVDWNNDDAYASPGAPPNGGDYVLAGRNARQLSAAEIREISFDGAETLEPARVEWTIDREKRPGDPALYSGSGDNLDRSMVEQVTVPAGGANLTFETLYETEAFFDYGIVQVSTDNGETWTSLANANTTTQTDTGPPISDNLPGLHGNSGGGAQPEWVTETFDLSAYAGRDILLSFRYLTDAGFALPGWWIDNVRVGTQLISDGTDLAEWQTATQVNPIEVAGFTVQVVAWMNDGSQIWVGEIPLGPGHVGSLEGQALEAAIGTTAENVGIIVTFDEPTESVSEYARYTLEVNNSPQPGG